MSDSASAGTLAHQVLLSMGFSRQEYCSRLPFPPPGDLPNPGIEPSSLMSPALAGRFFTTSTRVAISEDRIMKILKEEGDGRRSGRRLFQRKSEYKDSVVEMHLIFFNQLQEV